jgi:glutamate--cysteine ligase
VIDAQAGSDWEPVTAMVTALMDDERAADLAEEACTPVGSLSDPVRTAARHALADPLLASAALGCAEAALMALPRLGADGPTRTRAEDFVDRYTARGRCPANERLDRWQRTGSYFAPSEYEEDRENAR